MTHETNEPEKAATAEDAVVETVVETANEEAAEARAEALADSPARPGLEKAQPEPLGRSHLKSVIESLVFVSDKPVTDKELAKLVRSKPADLRPILDELIAEYRGRGLELIEVAGGFQFRTAAANAPFVRDYVAQKPVRLSRAQLETLSIIAYRQPITRPEVDEIRGVDSGSALKILLDRNLVKIIGKKEEAGRPSLFATTPIFLEFFGMNSLKDLPTLREFTDLSDESKALFERRLGEPLGDLMQAASEAANEVSQQKWVGDGEPENEDQLPLVDLPPEPGTTPEPEKDFFEENPDIAALVAEDEDEASPVTDEAESDEVPEESNDDDDDDDDDEE